MRSRDGYGGHPGLADINNARARRREMTRDSDGSGKIREREGCCDTWPKPCPYHEGWQDALETVSVLHAHPGIIHAHPGGALDHGPPPEPEPEEEE